MARASTVRTATCSSTTFWSSARLPIKRRTPRPVGSSLQSAAAAASAAAEQQQQQQQQQQLVDWQQRPGLLVVDWQRWPLVDARRAHRSRRPGRRRRPRPRPQSSTGASGTSSSSQHRSGWFELVDSGLGRRVSTLPSGSALSSSSSSSCACLVLLVLVVVVGRCRCLHGHQCDLTRSSSKRATRRPSLRSARRLCLSCPPPEVTGAGVNQQASDSDTLRTLPLDSQFGFGMTLAFPSGTSGASRTTRIPLPYSGTSRAC